MLVFTGMPIFFMEVTLGQYSGVGPNKLFELAPLFKGMCNEVRQHLILTRPLLVLEPLLTVYYCLSVLCNNKTRAKR